MLRAALPVSRRPAIAAGRQNVLNVSLFKRAFADDPKPSVRDPSPAVLPGSQSKTAPANTPSPPGPVSPSPPLSVSEKTIPPSNVPLTPPPPSGAASQTSPPSSIPPPSSPGSSQQPPKRKPRRFTRYFLAFMLLPSLFASGVLYSLRSDNFHDFFTEYIPFGEDAVLYFEEREFRKRFPRYAGTSHRASAGARITIPSNSGLSSKERDASDSGSDLARKGAHMSAVEDNKAPAEQQSKKQTNPAEAEKAQKPVAVKQQEKPTPAPEKPKAQEQPRKETVSPTAQPATTTNEAPSQPQPTKLPEVNEPSVFLPLARIDPLSIKNAHEPLVQDLVKMLNDIIAVVNADNATGKFDSSIAKAKNEVSAIGQKILALKASEQKAADERVNSTQADFDKAARELVRRLEQEMRDQEAQWRDEFESERQKMANIYDERFKSEIEKAKQISDQQVQNQLLEQSISLKKEFESAVQDQVETERQGRLSRLADVSSSIDELEKLTKQWNAVLDANIKTQHLQVAVEAVRSSLEKADRPRPFVRELAALKELAIENSVIDSAIASINPAAYQLGIPTSAQLIDRFRVVADEVRKASLLPEDAGIASHAASLFLSKVMFRKQGRAVGDDVESILTRTETLLEEGSFDEAAREMNTLQGWAKTLSSDWLGEVRKVLEVRQALDVISTEARLQSLKVN